MLQTRRRYFTPKWGQSWHQIGKCAMKSQTRSICHHSGHHIFPHTLMPPSETYIFLFFTATRIFPPSNSGSYLKVGTCAHPASVATYGWSDCGNYLCHLLWTYSIWVSGLWWKQLKVGDLGDGGKIQMAEQWRDQSSTMHFSPHFSMQTDVISLSNWVYLSYADSFWQVITQIKHGDALETALLLYDPQLVFTFHGTLQGIHAVFCHSTAFNSIREQDRGPRTL